MNYRDLAVKLQGQIHLFSGIFYPHFTKPQGKFIEQMVYGIQASRDTKLSSIARSLGEKISLKKTEERLSRHLAVRGLGQKVNEVLAEQGSRRVHNDTLIVIDPTDIRKPYARQMPHLGRVRDGSSGDIVNGYWACLAIACEPESRRMIPLHGRLWSTKAPDTRSENRQLLDVITTIATATNGRGIYVMDRGGDRIKLFSALLNKKLRFIIRLRSTRDVISRRSRRNVMELARRCRMLYSETIVKEVRGEEKAYHLEYGVCPVMLPGRGEQLYMVVVKGFGRDPMLLLTNVDVRRNRGRVESVVNGYLSRWLVEEAIRFLKQSYRLEDIRVLDYQRLKNLVALAVAASYFSAVWLGESLKLKVLATRVTQVAKRFFGVPDFHYYALSDGIATLLSRVGRWIHRKQEVKTARGRPQRLLFDFP